MPKMRSSLSTGRALVLALIAGGAIAATNGITTSQTKTDVPGAINLSGVSASEGSSLAHARADHVHSITGTLPLVRGGTGASSLLCGVGESLTANGTNLLCQTTVATSLLMPDTRLVATTPSSYSQTALFNFKAQGTIGLGSSGYAGVLGVAPWSDDSGGGNFELAFAALNAGATGGLYLRYGTRAGGFGGWANVLITAAGTTTLTCSTGQMLTASGTVSCANKDLANGITGVLGIPNGGTGAGTVANNLIFSGPSSGGPLAPSFRALVASDIPNLDTGKLTTGTLPEGRGGTGQGAFTCLAGQYVTSNGTSLSCTDKDLGNSNGATPLPIANGGTGAATAANNVFFGGPNGGGPLAPSFRALVANDIPSLDTGKITTGTLGEARGGTGAGAITCTAGQVVTSNGTAYSCTNKDLANGNGTSITPIANGGTGSSTRNFVDLTSSETVAGVKNFSSNPTTTAGGAAGAGTQSLASNLYTQSRGMNLITNGFALLGNNYNFSSFTLDQVNTHAGKGSFKIATFNADVKSDELIPVDPTRTYRLTLWGNSTTHASGAHHYIGVSPYDIDGNFIESRYYMRGASTDTTLAVTLSPGATTITLTSAANWATAGGTNGTFSRQMIWFDYQNSFGYTYPAYTYSRHQSSNDSGYSTNGLWANAGSISGNVITLTAPWPAGLGTIPAGTAVSAGNAGSTYKYIAAVNVDIPSSWTQYSGTIGGYDLNGVNATNLFPYGTAQVKLLFLVNRDVAGNTVNFSDLWFSELTINNLEGLPGTGTTFNPVPSTATLLAGQDSANNLIPLKVCDKSSPIAITFGGAGTSQVVAAVSSKKVYVCGFYVVSTAQVSLKLVEGTGSTCTTPSDVTGAAAVGVNGGWVVGLSSFPVPLTANASSTLCLNSTGAATVGGWVSYTQQ